LQTHCYELNAQDMADVPMTCLKLQRRFRAGSAGVQALSRSEPLFTGENFETDT
jgi:hypothetical protein